MIRFNLIASSVLTCLALIAVQPASAAGFGDSLVVVISGGMRGRVNGCGCASGPEGGLDRRETLIKKRFGSLQPVGLDCGAILDLDPAGGVARSRCLLAGLARQGLKVGGVAGRDLYYGIKFLKESAEKAGVALVSANLVEPNGRSPFPAWQTVLVNDKRFAVTSLCEPLPSLAAPGSLVTLPPDSVMRKLASSVPANSDLIVLLTDMGEASLRTLLNSTNLFDIALTCSRQVFSATPFECGKSLVVRPEPDGRSLEVLILPRNGPARNGRVIRDPVERSTPSDPVTTQWLNDCLNTPLEK